MKLISRLRTLIDLRAGILSAFVMGTTIWFINMAATTPPDLFGSTTAALKQAAYSFIFGGLVIRCVTWLATRQSKHSLRTLLTAMFVPGWVTCGLNYLLHCLRGTPSPFLSTIPVILLSTLILPFWAIHQRRKYLNNLPG